MNIQITSNQWESDFFNRAIGKLNFIERSLATLPPYPVINVRDNFQLIQAKVASSELNHIAYLQQNGFQLVEGEVDFCLGCAKNLLDLSVAQIAQVSDIEQLEKLFGDAFLTSRFREPWFSREENQRFYQTWIRKAVRGEFDHLCLIIKHNEKIKGGISVRLIGDQARVGVLAVSAEFQRQGVAKQLFQAAIEWAKKHKAEKLWVATQMSNIAAINLYQKCGATINSTNYWFYKSNLSKHA